MRCKGKSRHCYSGEPVLPAESRRLLLAAGVYRKERAGHQRLGKRAVRTNFGSLGTLG